MPDRDAEQRKGRNESLLLILIGLIAVSLAIPYGLLVLLTTGSGWSYPNLLPDRIDFAPWKHTLGDRDGLLRATATSLAMSVAVSIPSTACGLIAGRALQRYRSALLRYLAYLPFVLSPMIVGACFYDLAVRTRLAGTTIGVIACQTMFAFAFAMVMFCELWSPQIERAEQTVATLGGGVGDVWRHAVLPRTFGLIVVCLIQTGLHSWLDYGLVALIGGGQVKTLTTQLFAYIREASVNQAALSGLLLLSPVVGGYLVTMALLAQRTGKEAT